MKGSVKRIMIVVLLLIGFSVNWVTFAEALDVKLLWMKEFKNSLIGIDFADVSGDLLISKGKKDNVMREIILYDKGGNERFHWGPRMDRRVGVATISDDGKYFVFTTGYTEEYAKKKNLAVIWGEMLHFYDRQTKKELWNKSIGEESPVIFPDGSSVIIYGYETGNFEIYNQQGKSILQLPQEGGISDIGISPEGHYFALVRDSDCALVLYRRDGTKLWEKGCHKEGIASISNEASYISTYPYSLGLSDVADELNTHKGTVYDRNGNKVMEGFGVLAPNGSKIAMLYPDKVSVLSWPDKKMVKEIMIDMREIFKTSSTSNTGFSDDGRYLFVKSGTSIKVYDLLENINKEIKIPEMGKNLGFTASADGKYLLINPEEIATIYFYQIY
jgi:dipeptidyl aminopeptidase/acylaminoacyl peptidase